MFPTWVDFKKLFRELLSISLAIFAIKIIYTYWEKSGTLLLGLSVSKEMVAYFTFALLYAKKLMMVSDSVTDVSLPVLSDKYVNDINEFKKLFIDNFNKVFSAVLLSATLVVFWAKEIVWLAVAWKSQDGNKYVDSLPLILPLGFAFVMYAFMNILTSSILIPAKLVKEMIVSFFIMLLITAVSYFGFRTSLGPLEAMSYGMLAGAFFGLVLEIILSQRKLSFKFVNIDHILVLVQGAVIAYSSFTPNIFVKSGLFVMFFALYIWNMFASHFIDKNDILYIFGKLRRIFRRV
jgi:O-antigen/teichoic acid export membrane protein